METEEEAAVAQRCHSEEKIPDLIDAESLENEKLPPVPFRTPERDNMAEGGPGPGSRGSRQAFSFYPFSDEEDEEYGLGLEYYNLFGPQAMREGGATAHAFFRGLTHYDVIDSEDEYLSGYTLSDESLSDFEGTAQGSGPIPGGYDYDFLETPPEDLQCSVCLFVLCDPQLTSCCGHHFCKGCISRVIMRGKSCPLCQAGEFTVMLDKNFQRKINELKIKCPKNANGCEWVGEVKRLDSHVNVRDGDCGYVEVACEYRCGEEVRRRDMADHIESSCSQRPYICKHCGHKASFAGITVVHFSACKKYPVRCPNDCGIESIPRDALRQHTDTECPLEAINCEFHFAGCCVCTPRKDMPKHTSENVQSHLSMVAQNFQLKLEDKDKKITTLESSLEEQKSKISALQLKVNQQKQQIQRLESKSTQPMSSVKSSSPVASRVTSIVYRLPPVDFVMLDFPALKASNKQWFSEPFYTGVKGYKMCLSAFANGIGVGRGNHVSLFANMMQGGFDDCLSWPFRGSVSVQLLIDDKKEYYEANLLFSTRSPARATARVCGFERNSFGQGSVRFLPHSRLQPLPPTLRLRVCKVSVL